MTYIIIHNDKLSLSVYQIRKTIHKITLTEIKILLVIAVDSRKNVLTISEKRKYTKVHYKVKANLSNNIKNYEPYKVRLQTTYLS